VACDCRCLERFVRQKAAAAYSPREDQSGECGRGLSGLISRSAGGLSGGTGQLFAERGYHATTVADIAEKAEVAPRTVAVYFPTKQDIALSRFSSGITSLHEALTGREPGESTTAVLGRWLLTSQPGPEDAELTRLARRMFAANPDLAALRQAQLAAAIRDGAAMIARISGATRTPSARDSRPPPPRPS
jgi:AcrR family transcriptional regulator